MYKQINIKKYLKEIKKKYTEQPELWYATILPKEKAEELMKQCNNDYSLIWHEHCSECWCSIDSDLDNCYCDDESKDWLCNECYENLKANSNIE